MYLDVKTGCRILPAYLLTISEKNMLKQNLILVSIATSLFVFAFLFANSYAGESQNLPGASGEDGTPKPGFSGHIFIGAGYVGGNVSNEDAEEDDNARINSLNQSGQSLSEFEVIYGFGLNYYVASTRTLFSIGGEGEGPGLSATQFMGAYGSLTLGFGYSENDVWADPFLVNTARPVTDMESFIYLIAWDEIMDSPFSLSYELESIDIDNDLSGRRNRDLARDGEIHTFTAGSGLYEDGTHSVSASLHYTMGDMTGKSYSFDGFGTGLSHTVHGDGWELETGAQITIRDYDAVHPEFNKTRDEKEYTLGTAYTLFEPFGWKNYFITMFGSYTVNDSNIKFYDSDVVCTGMAVGYSF